MNTEKLQQYLGMAFHFVYYHHHNLYNDEIFPDNYWEELKNSADIEYWQNVYEALDYALQQEDYCIDILIYPQKDRYAKNEVMLFFEKFHLFLKEHLN